jgi:hypothetical protein
VLRWVFCEKEMLTTISPSSTLECQRRVVWSAEDPLRFIRNLVSASSKSTSYAFVRHEPKHKLLVQISLASCNTLCTFSSNVNSAGRMLMYTVQWQAEE